jgi:hypothetical protein
VYSSAHQGSVECVCTRVPSGSHAARGKHGHVPVRADCVTDKLTGRLTRLCTACASNVSPLCSLHWLPDRLTGWLQPSRELPLGGVGADAIAQMVDMSEAEVADLMGPQRVGGAASEEALLGVGARAQALLLQIQVALASGASYGAPTVLCWGRVLGHPITDCDTH